MPETCEMKHETISNVYRLSNYDISTLCLSSLTQFRFLIPIHSHHGRNYRFKYANFDTLERIQHDFIVSLRTNCFGDAVRVLIDRISATSQGRQ